MIYAERTHGRMYYLFFAAVLSVWNRDLYWIRHWKTVPVEADVRQWRCERVWIRECNDNRKEN